MYISICLILLLAVKTLLLKSDFINLINDTIISLGSLIIVIIFENGKHTLDSIIKEIRKGVIINRFSGNVNPVNGDFSGVVKGGHLIENGNITCPVKEVMVAGNIFDSLMNISALSRERKKIFDSFLPYISIENISFTGG